MDNDSTSPPPDTTDPTRPDDIMNLLLRLLRSRSRATRVAREVVSLTEIVDNSEENNAHEESDLPASEEDVQPMDTSSDEERPRRTQDRYRLIVYIEERTRDTNLNNEEPAPTPTRYIAIIVGNHDDLQQIMNGLNTSVDDVLNHLFSTYAPKGTPPAKTEFIDSLPLTKIMSNSTIGRCAVCLEEFNEGSEAIVLPCKHCFHDGEECVKHWLRMHNSCPVCRYEMPVEDVEYEQGRKQRMEARGFSEEETR